MLLIRIVTNYTANVIEHQERLCALTFLRKAICFESVERLSNTSQHRARASVRRTNLISFLLSSSSATLVRT